MKNKFREEAIKNIGDESIMELSQVLETAAAIITSIGGAGFIICAFAKFLSNRIADRIVAQYEQRLKKELENYKAKLENKRYITQLQFDVEFKIYQKITKAFFELLIKLSTISEKEFYENTISEVDKIEQEKNFFLTIVDTASNAQNLLFENVPFIQENIYKKYEELYEMFNKQFWLYHERSIAYFEGKIKATERFSENDKKCFEEIESKFFAINADVRFYLGTLAIK